jgi:hypothetical protein
MQNLQKIRAAGAALLALGLASCESMITGGPLLRPGEPVGVLELVNVSRSSVTAIAISDCSASTYGLNRLPSGMTIPPGRSYSFQVSAGCWDIFATHSNAASGRLRTRVGPNGRTRVNMTTS